MADTIKSGDICTVARDIVIGGETAFKEGELVLIEDIAPNQQRPESKYVVRSRSLDKLFQLSDADIHAPLQSKGAPKTRERTEPREGFNRKWLAIGLGILGALVVTVVIVLLLPGESKKPSGIVWVVGDGGTILITTDDGVSWNSQDSGTQGTIYSISAFDEKTALAGGAKGKVFKTTDGGASWAPHSSDTEDAIHQIVMVSEDAAWARAGNFIALRTIDGGAAWTPSTMKTSPRSLYADNPDKAWTMSSDGALIRTVNGGEDWGYRDTDVPLAGSGFKNVRDFTAANYSTAWVVRADGAIFKTTNGGDTWEEKESKATKDLYCIDAADEKVVWVAGHKDTVLLTIDGGETWKSLSTGTGCNFRRVCAVDENTAWLLGNTGADYTGATLLLKTSDGGNTWETQKLGTNATLHDIGLVK